MALPKFFFVNCLRDGWKSSADPQNSADAVSFTDKKMANFGMHARCHWKTLKKYSKRSLKWCSKCLNSKGFQGHARRFFSSKNCLHRETSFGYTIFIPEQKDTVFWNTLRTSINWINNQFISKSRHKDKLLLISTKKW